MLKMAPHIAATLLLACLSGVAYAADEETQPVLPPAVQDALVAMEPEAVRGEVQTTSAPAGRTAARTAVSDRNAEGHAAATTAIVREDQPGDGTPALTTATTALLDGPAMKAAPANLPPAAAAIAADVASAEAQPLPPSLLSHLDGTPSAAPGTDGSVPASGSEAAVNPLARATGALVLGLFLLGGLLLHPKTRVILLDRVRSGNLGGRRDTGPTIDVRSTANVGAGQRVVVLEVDGARLLVGVSQGRMDVLHSWSNAPTAAPALAATGEIPSSLDALYPLGAPEEVADAFAPAAEAAPAPAPLPNASQWMAAWQRSAESVPEAPSAIEDEDHDDPWWLEGATETEKERIAHAAEADLEEQAVHAAESVLEQLRAARSRETLADRSPRLARLGRTGTDSSDPAPEADERPRHRGLPRAVLSGLIALGTLAILGFAPDAMAGDGSLMIDLGANELGDAVTGGAGASTAVKLLVTLSLLAIAPAIVLSMTSFTRLIVVFGLLRQAVGVQQAPPNQVLVGLALFLTWFVMAPTFDRVNDVAVEPYFDGMLTEGQALTAAMGPMRDFMMRNTREKDLALMLQLSHSTRPETRADVPTRALVPAFMISELKTAFQIGFLIYIPFLIIDLVVATVLLAMGMMVLPPIVISLPFKLLLFVFVDGWNMLVGSLVAGFA